MGLLSCLAVLATAASREVADGGTVFPDVQEKLAGILGLPADDAGRIALVRGRTPAPVPQSRVEALVGALSAPRFVDRDRAERELIRGGPAVGDALAGSREVWPGDPEARSRLERVVAAIADNWRPERVADYKTAVKLLSRRDPEGVTTLFLDVLPVLGEDALHFDVWRAMDRLARRAGAAPAVCETVTADDHPTKRAIAAYLLTRRGTERQRDLGRRALADPDTMVRLRAAQGLLGARDPAAVPALIDLLDKKPRTTGWQAEEMLTWAAGALAPTEVLGGEGDGLGVQRAWRAAWDKHGPGLLAGPKDPLLPKRPLLAIIQWGGGMGPSSRRPQLIGSNGAERWRPELPDWDLYVGQVLAADRVLCLAWARQGSARWMRQDQGVSLVEMSLTGQSERKIPVNVKQAYDIAVLRQAAGWALVAGFNRYGFVSPNGAAAENWVEVTNLIGRKPAPNWWPVDRLFRVTDDVAWYEYPQEHSSYPTVVGVSTGAKVLLHHRTVSSRALHADLRPTLKTGIANVSLDDRTFKLVEGYRPPDCSSRRVNIDDRLVSAQFPVMRLGFGE